MRLKFVDGILMIENEWNEGPPIYQAMSKVVRSADHSSLTYETKYEDLISIEIDKRSEKQRMIEHAIDYIKMKYNLC